MKPPCQYYGGKQNMVNQILSLIPKHEIYVEPFVGGGAIFYAKEPSKVESINDINEFVVNFYRVIKTKFSELQLMIQGTLHSESDKIKSRIILKTNTGTDIEKAWAFWCQCTLTFGSVMFGGFAFGNENDTSQPRKTNNYKYNFIDKYCERLERTEIFCRDAINLIKLKDTKNTFFYCDPPYVSSDCGSYKGYTMDDFKNLLDTLSNIKGKFLLSSYPEEILLEYRKLHNWNQKDVVKIVAIDGKRENCKLKTECLTWNYTINDNKIKSLF